MCGAGSSRIKDTARATSTAEIGEVLPLPIDSANLSASRTPAATKRRKKPSRKTVGRTVTTGSPDHDRACSASQCSLCCGLSVVSVMLICVTVICDNVHEGLDAVVARHRGGVDRGFQISRREPGRDQDPCARYRISLRIP